MAAGDKRFLRKFMQIELFCVRYRYLFLVIDYLLFDISVLFYLFVFFLFLLVIVIYFGY